MIQIPIDPEIRPYLVSSVDRWVWVSRTGSVARVAFQPIPNEGLESLARQVLVEIVNQSKVSGWGSVHPLTKEGMVAALAHPTSYGYQTIPLVSPDLDLEALGLDPLKVEIAEWLPEKTLLALPVDRELSAQALVHEGNVAAIVLDPSRAFGIAQNPPE